MDIINSDWIKERLDGHRGEKAALAQAVGITPKQLSYILGGTRAVKQEELEAFRNFFSHGTAPQAVSGFSEPDVEVITPKRGTDAAALLQIVKKPGQHPQLYKITGPLAPGGLSEGDIVVMDLKGAPRPGDLVICTIIDPETEQANTRIRQWYEPWLISQTGADRIDDTGSSAILGKVTGSIRGVEL